MNRARVALEETLGEERRGIGAARLGHGCRLEKCSVLGFRGLFEVNLKVVDRLAKLRRLDERRPEIPAQDRKISRI